MPSAVTAFLSSGASLLGTNASPSSRESLLTMVLIPASATYSSAKNLRHMESVSDAATSASAGVTISTSCTLGILRRSAMSALFRSVLVGGAFGTALLDMKS